MTDRSAQTAVPVSHRLVNYARRILIAAVVVAAVTGQAATVGGLVVTQPSATTDSVQDTPTVTVGDRDVAVGETVTVPVRLSEAPAGIAGFNLSVTTTDATVVTIVDVAVDDQYGFATPSADETGATLVASDTGDEVQSGATNVRLGSVTVRAESAGTAELRVDVTQFDDDEGGRVSPQVESGTVNVGDASTESTTTATETSTNGSDIFQTPGGTESPTPTVSATPTALATASPTESATPTPTASESPTATASESESLTASESATESDPDPPAETSATRDTATETSGDGFQAVLGILALLGVALVARRRE